nr:hypothetical protein [Dehalococcoidia bacterium]
ARGDTSNLRDHRQREQVYCKYFSVSDICFNAGRILRVRNRDMDWERKVVLNKFVELLWITILKAFQ